MRPLHFLTDLDGTLLRSDATLSDFTIEVVNRALSDGHIISFATARSFVSAQPIVQRIHWSFPIIIYNGALIIDPRTKQVLDGQFLNQDLAAKVLTLGRKHRLVPLFFGVDALGAERVWHEHATHAGQRQFVASRSGDSRFTLTEHVEVRTGDRVIMLTYMGSEEDLIPLKRAVEDAFAEQVYCQFAKDTYLRDTFFLDFSHPQANKGDATRKWASLVRCAPEDVTVFGDNLNDLGLFHAAGMRVAVENAHADIKALADVQVAANNDDGVARFIREATDIDVIGT